MKEIKPYTPTRACPHRHCRKVHRFMGLLGITIVVIESVSYPLLLLGLVVFVVLAISISALTHRRTMKEELLSATMDDLKPTVPLVVRRGWANVAVGLDAFFALNGSGMIYSLLTEPSSYRGTSGLSTLLAPVGLTVSMALFWFTTYAHRKATEPAAPKRVPVPEAA